MCQFPGEGCGGRKLSSWLTPGGRVSSGRRISPNEGVVRPVDSRVARQVVQTILKRELRALGHGLGRSCYRESELDVGGSGPVLEGSEAAVVVRAWWAGGELGLVAWTCLLFCSGGHLCAQPHVAHGGRYEKSPYLIPMPTPRPVETDLTGGRPWQTLGLQCPSFPEMLREFRAQF